MAIERVRSRVQNGGHSIPEDVIIRRYYRGLFNLIHIYSQLANNWFVLNNSAAQSHLIVEGHNGLVSQVTNDELWKVIKTIGNEQHE